MDKEWRDKLTEHNKFEWLSTFSVSSEDEPTQQISLKANSDIVWIKLEEVAMSKQFNKNLS